MKTRPIFAFPLLLSISLGALILLGAAAPEKGAPAPLLDPRETHLAGAVQLTDGGENAEAYWSPDGKELSFQTTRPPFACDQIFRMPADGSGPPVQVSSGKGRTTCAYFTSDGRRILYSSTHQAGDACPPPPDRSQGYVWPIDPDFEIWSALPDGSDLRRLTENDAYDAESTVCPVDGSVIFTSTRDGDLDLYRMTSDGKAVTRLTHTPGYDGGAFFSNDCRKIVWRASRPAGTELEDYRRLLAQGLVRPSKLEIWVANADGSDARQVTSLGAASFAPSFFPSGDRILFSSNYGDPKGREFEIWAVNVDGSDLERITWSDGFDGFPLFSPDGTRLAFSSNRHQGKPGETNVFVAKWIDPVPPLPGPLPRAGGEGASPPSASAQRYLDDVRWLADDAREGRGIGTRGLEESSRYLERRFREIGIEPAGQDGTYFQRFEAPVAVEARAGTAVTLDGEPLARAEFEPASFSASSKVEGEIVAAGYGITAPDLGVDDYKGIDAAGKIVAVRRFTPTGEPFNQEDVERRYGDLRYKTFNAREHGALGVIVVDAPLVNEGEETPPEAPLPALRLDSGLTAAAGDAGIPVVTLSRAAGSALLQGGDLRRKAALAVELEQRHEPVANVIGVIRAGAAGRLPGALVVGAHAHEPHNGADDNASGTAALLEVGRLLAGRRDRLHRDVYLIAFTGEEMGVLGSTAFTRKPTAGLRMEDLVAMLNMDMVGRLRGNALSVLGGESAAEWHEIVEPLCERAGFACSLGGDGYGPSDQYPFYAAGVPVLHFFTGVHEDYHKPSDDSDKINAEGGVRVAALVAEVAEGLSGRAGRLAYNSLPAPAPRGDARSLGASLGTVPDYAGDGRPGVLLSGVRAGSAAEQAGLQRGDLLVELGGTPIRDIHDFMYVLRRAKPGDKAAAVVLRGEERVTFEVIYGVSRGMR